MSFLKYKSGLPVPLLEPFSGSPLPTGSGPDFSVKPARSSTFRSQPSFPASVPTSCPAPPTSGPNLPFTPLSNAQVLPSVLAFLLQGALQGAVPGQLCEAHMLSLLTVFHKECSVMIPLSQGLGRVCLVSLSRRRWRGPCGPSHIWLARFSPGPRRVPGVLLSEGATECEGGIAGGPLPFPAGREPWAAGAACLPSLPAIPRQQVVNNIVAYGWVLLKLPTRKMQRGDDLSREQCCF